MDRLPRYDLSELSPSQIAPIEALFVDGFPEAWRDFARSCYLTLLWLHQARDATDLADEAVELAKGISKDLGGSQPYIPTGRQLEEMKKTQRVLSALRSGAGYKVAARTTGLTERQVRRIEAESRENRKAICQ